MTPRICWAKSFTLRRSRFPWVSSVRSAASAAFGAQLVVAGGDLARAPLQVGHLDQPGLEQIDEAASLGVGAVDLAVEPGEFGGE